MRPVCLRNSLMIGRCMYLNNATRFLITSLLLLISSQNLMAAVDLAYETSSGGGEWHLSWDSAVTVDVEQDGRELILRFDRSLGEMDVASLQQAFAGLIESAQYGYDSLVVRVAPQVEQQVLVRKRSVSVRLTVRPSEEPLCPQGQLSAPARLRYLAAVAQLELGQLDAARAELDALREECPDSGDVHAASGRLEERAGRWYLALDHYEHARAKGFTQHEPAEASLRRQHDAHAEFKLLRSEDKQDARRVSKSFKFKQPVSEHNHMSLTLSHHDVHLADVTGVTGQPDVEFMEGRFTLESVTGERELQALAMTVLPGVVGGGYRYHHFADDARTEFSVEINALDTTDITRMAQEGRRDVVGLQQSRYRSELVSISYGLDVVRYHGLWDQQQWAGGYTATVDYLLLQEPVDVFAKYALDGESVRQKTSAQSSAQTAPLPQDFENHSLAGVLAAPWVADAHVTLELGYTWDRLGGQGPYQALNINTLSGALAAYGVGVRHGRRDNSAVDDDVLEMEFTVQVPF